MWARPITGCLFQPCSVKTVTSIVIKEAMWNELGYAVTDRHKRFTRQLFKAYQAGEDINDINLNPQSNTPERFFKNVDGIKFLNHAGGCGGIRQDSETLSALPDAYADHPDDVAWITVLSLGCQHLQVKDFMRDLKQRNPSFDKPLYIFEQQQSQSEEQLVTEAIRQTFKGLVEINQLEREPAPLSALCIGVKCGGSDGFSGISANPAVGYTSDLLVALGGKVLLAEFPELCGAEQDLIDRCPNENTANKFIRLMETYDNEAKSVGSGFSYEPITRQYPRWIDHRCNEIDGSCKERVVHHRWYRYWIIRNRHCYRD